MAGHVFISYSRTDRSYVDGLANHLQAAGIPVWFDFAVEPGDSFGPKIQEAIDECGVFVVVLTAASASSEWVQREISRAIRAKKPVRPLLLQQCNTPIELEGVQHEDVTRGQLPSRRFTDGVRKQLSRSSAATAVMQTPAGPQTRRRPPALIPVAAIALAVLLVAGGVSLVRYVANQGVLAAPTLQEPADGITLTNFPRAVTLRWQPVSGATQYRIEIQCDTCGSVPWTTWKTDTTTSTSYDITWVGDNTGRWRVTALDTGGAGDPSNWWTFSFHTAPPPPPADLAVPVQTSPDDGATFTNYPRDLTLSWQAVSGATQYRVEIQCDTCGATPWTTWKTDTTSTTSYSFVWVGDNTGRWRVTALDADRASQPSPWRTFSFHTGPTLLPAPTQVSPADGASFNIFPRTTTLTWTAVPGAAQYHVEVQCDVCGSTPWVPWIDKTVTATSYTFDWVGAQSGRWRVTAIDANGTAGTPSGFWTFTYTK
jgi:hypothetical protein